MLLNSKHQIEGIGRSIEDVFITDKKNSKFKEEFKLLRKNSEDQMLFRYLLTGRIGYIKVLLKKEDNKLLIEIFQAPLGFGVPVILFFAAIMFFVLYRSPASLYLLSFGLFWLFLICFFFKSDSKNIKKSIADFLSNQM
jgi:hypothetical protein